MTSPASIEAASQQSEATIRRMIRQTDRAIEMMRNALRHYPDMPVEERHELRLYMRRCQRIVTYGTYVMAHLPVDPVGRAQALENHVQALRLTAEQVLRKSK